MGVEKERKSTFLTALEQREKEARSLFAAESFKVFSSQVMTCSNRVTRTVESLRVIGLQVAMKRRPTGYKMAPDKIENCAQHSMKWLR